MDLTFFLNLCFSYFLIKYRIYISVIYCLLLSREKIFFYDGDVDEKLVLKKYIYLLTTTKNAHVNNYFVKQKNEFCLRIFIFIFILVS